MATKKISALTELTTPAGTEELIVNAGGTSKKIQIDNLPSSLADNSVTLAKMAGGTDGNLITYDASGDPAYVTTGTSGQVLTSGGAGVAPTFQTAAGGVAGISTSSTSGTAISIDANNIVTKGSNPAFFADTAGSWLLISPSTWTKISFYSTSGSSNAESFDIGSDFSVANDRFTAPVAGTYIFTACIYWKDFAAANESRYTGFYVNGTRRTSTYNNSTYADDSTLTSIFNLSANDYVEVYGLSSHPSVSKYYREAEATWFMGSLIG